jgi:arsenate reductase
VKKRVLFLCTGNSARSQMAEGLVNHDLGDEWQALSAGIEPAGTVHPLAVRAMAELGIDISRQRSKPVDEFRGREFDLVVTVCDDAAENCPVWLGRGQKVHLGTITRFLKSIPDNGLKGVQVAAFDTRATESDIEKVKILAFFVKIFGYAAEPIANRLKKKGGALVVPAKGFYVAGTEGPLLEGELERAADWAREILESARR